MAEQGSVIPIFRSEAVINEHRQAAHAAICQALADQFPLELFPEDSPECQTADALDAAIFGFFERDEPVENFPILRDRRARQILWFCIHNRVTLDTPEPYAHIQRLERALSAPPRKVSRPLQHPPRLRAIR